MLIVAGMGLTVLGIQQSTVWGWGDARTLGSVAAGLLILVAFVFAERNTEDPLIDVRAMTANRPFAVDNILTFLVFSPLNADALNQLSDSVRGQGSGIIQTCRNFGSALGMAVMGTIIASATDVTGPFAVNDFVDAMKSAWYVGAGMLAAGWLLCQLFMPGGTQQDIE